MSNRKLRAKLDEPIVVNRVLLLNVVFGCETLNRTTYRMIVIILNSGIET